MLNALRLVEGFSLADFEVRTGLDRGAIAGELATAHDRGWLEADGERWRPTELGRRFTNDVIGLFLR
jgi:oxygen-independent coproporphyrinogen-3 oxidase